MKKVIHESKSPHTERSVVQTMLVMSQKHGETAVMPTIVTLIGDKDYLRKKGKKAKELRHKPNDKEFTGFVYESLLNGKIRNAYYYTEGKKTHKMFYAKAMRGTELGENDFRLELSFFDMALNSVAYNSWWEYIYCSLCGTTYHEDYDCNCSIYVDYCGSCYSPVDNCYCCPSCGQRNCICWDYCYHCGSYPCVCYVNCWYCGNDPCTCFQLCNECGMLSCFCCNICGTFPCQCFEPNVCSLCGYDPCRCSIDPPPTGNSEIDKIVRSYGNLTQSQAENLKTILENVNDGETYNLFFKMLEQLGVQIVFGIDWNIVTSNGQNIDANACYMKGTEYIYFKDGNSIKMGYFTEELIHMIQYEQFYGVVMEPQILNYEFEAKLFEYILCDELGGSSKISYADDDLQNEYDQWIAYIRQKPDSEDILDKYYYFLERWESGYNGSIDYSLRPEMILFYR